MLRVKAIVEPSGDQDGKLSMYAPSVSTVVCRVVTSRIRRPLPDAFAERNTSRRASGDQLGKPSFTSPAVSNCSPDPSAWTSAMFETVAGRPIMPPKNAPNPNAMRSPVGEKTAATELLSGSSKMTRRFVPSACMDRMPLCASARVPVPLITVVPSGV